MDGQAPEQNAAAEKRKPLLPVTVVIPVKNEDQNLSRCLETCGFAAHVVVVDSGSRDRTCEIAREKRAEVIQFDWKPGGDKKRNWMLRTYPFSTPWVLFLDADERVTSDVERELRIALCDESVSGYWLRYTTYFMGKKLRFGLRQRKLALFKVGRGFYEDVGDAGWSNLDMEVHEHPIIEGKVGCITAPIEHNDFKGLHHFVGKHNEYSSWEAQRIVQLSRAHLASFTVRQRLKYALVRKPWFAPLYFLAVYLGLLGFLDGRSGLRYAAQKWVYFTHVRLKVLELENRSPHDR